MANRPTRDPALPANQSRSHASPRDGSSSRPAQTSPLAPVNAQPPAKRKASLLKAGDPCGDVVDAAVVSGLGPEFTVLSCTALRAVHPSDLPPQALRYSFIGRHPKLIVGLHVAATDSFDTFYATLEHINAAIDHIIHTDAITLPPELLVAHEQPPPLSRFTWKDFLVCVTIDGPNPAFLQLLGDKLALYAPDLGGEGARLHAYEKTVVLPPIALAQSKFPLPMVALASSGPLSAEEGSAWLLQGVTAQFEPPFVAQVRVGVNVDATALSSLLYHATTNADAGVVFGVTTATDFPWSSLWGAAREFESALSLSYYDAPGDMIGWVQHPSSDLLLIRTGAVRGAPLFNYHRNFNSSKRTVTGLKALAVPCRADVLSTSVVLVGDDTYMTALNVEASGTRATAGRLHPSIANGYTAVNQHILLPFFETYKVMKLRTSSGHSASRVCAFAMLAVWELARAVLTWFSPASLFLAFHTILYIWAGAGAHMHVFEALYATLFGLQVCFGLGAHAWLSVNGTPSTTSLPTWLLSPTALWLYDVSGLLLGTYAYFSLAQFAVIIHNKDASIWFLAAFVFVLGCTWLAMTLAGHFFSFVRAVAQYAYYFPSWVNIVLPHSFTGGFVKHLHSSADAAASSPVASPVTPAAADVKFVTVGAGPRADAVSQFQALMNERTPSSLWKAPPRIGTGYDLSAASTGVRASPESKQSPGKQSASRPVAQPGANEALMLPMPITPETKQHDPSHANTIRVWVLTSWLLSNLCFAVLMPVFHLSSFYLAALAWACVGYYGWLTFLALLALLHRWWYPVNPVPISLFAPTTRLLSTLTRASHSTDDGILSTFRSPQPLRSPTGSAHGLSPASVVPLGLSPLSQKRSNKASATVSPAAMTKTATPLSPNSNHSSKRQLQRSDPTAVPTSTAEADAATDDSPMLLPRYRSSSDSEFGEREHVQEHRQQASATQTRAARRSEHQLEESHITVNSLHSHAAQRRSVFNDTKSPELLVREMLAVAHNEVNRGHVHDSSAVINRASALSDPSPLTDDGGSSVNGGAGGSVHSSLAASNMLFPGMMRLIPTNSAQSIQRHESLAASKSMSTFSMGSVDSRMATSLRKLRSFHKGDDRPWWSKRSYRSPERHSPVVVTFMSPVPAPAPLTEHAASTPALPPASIVTSPNSTPGSARGTPAPARNMSVRVLSRIDEDGPQSTRPSSAQDPWNWKAPAEADAPALAVMQTKATDAAAVQSAPVEHTAEVAALEARSPKLPIRQADLAAQSPMQTGSSVDQPNTTISTVSTVTTSSRATPATLATALDDDFVPLGKKLSTSSVGSSPPPAPPRAPPKPVTISIPTGPAPPQGSFTPTLAVINGEQEMKRSRLMSESVGGLDDTLHEIHEETDEADGTQASESSDVPNGDVVEQPQSQAELDSAGDEDDGEFGDLDSHGSDGEVEPAAADAADAPDAADSSDDITANDTSNASSRVQGHATVPPIGVHRMNSGYMSTDIGDDDSGDFGATATFRASTLSSGFGTLSATPGVTAPSPPTVSHRPVSVIATTASVAQLHRSATEASSLSRAAAQPQSRRRSVVVSETTQEDVDALYVDLATGAVVSASHEAVETEVLDQISAWRRREQSVSLSESRSVSVIVQTSTVTTVQHEFDRTVTIVGESEVEGDSVAPRSESDEEDDDDEEEQSLSVAGTSEDSEDGE